MTITERINGFVQLGHLLEAELAKVNPEELPDSELGLEIMRAQQLNQWFVPQMSISALQGVLTWLNEAELTNWADNYPKLLSGDIEPKTVGVVAAGNIPVVGFHDCLCVLLAGHRLQLKVSGSDKVLLPWLLNALINSEPGFSKFIEIIEDRLDKFDAVIATGSNNTARYFEYYFGKYPHIIRKNRTSVGVVIGEESQEELDLLASDISFYYGLGCRNVTKLLVHESFDLDRLFKALQSQSWMMDSNRYMNNYQYHKTIHLLNNREMLDNEFMVLIESKELHSPIGVVHYQRFKDFSEVEDYLSSNADQIQCVIGKEWLEYGESQKPGLSDYADGIDTMEFLVNI